MKTCTKCKKEKSEQEFYKRQYNKDGIASQCKDCRKKQIRTPEQRKYQREYKKKWWQNASLEEKTKKLLRNTIYYKNLRDEVLEKYGNKCVCCGEMETSFLSLDHKNNDGNLQRKQMNIKHGSGTRRVHQWAKRNNYPNTLQILCFNCNIAKYRLGQCPHKKYEQ